jgi:Fn3 associated/Chitobiase/beta-hexosaminidase C-terminal domain
LSNFTKRRAQANIILSGTKYRPLSNSAICIAVLAASAFAAVSPCWAQTSVLTQHNDIGRTGQNTSETILSTSNVSVNQFGKLFALPVSGQVYAQPLYVPNVLIAGVMHNVVIVATEADMVYAFDADSNTGSNASPLWSASMVDAAHGAGAGETSLNESTTTHCADLQPQIGISSTPVIDPVTQTIYVEARSVVVTTSAYIHRLHALSLTTGAEIAPGPVVIAATVKGTGDGSKNGNLSFDNLHEQNRAGLLELNGAIYLAFASLCDHGPYHGWIFAYDAVTLAQKSLLITTPNGGLGGFWMSGAGVAADASSNIYIASGNGDFDTTNVPATELGDTIMKLGTVNESLSLLDYFTPSDQMCLQTEDKDLGSGGVLALPDQPGSFPHILVEAGKEGKIYVVNRDSPMTTTPTHYNPLANCASSDPEILEESASGAIGGMFGLPAYWNSTLYFWGSGDVLKSIPVVNGLPNFSAITSGSTKFQFPGATPSISSNGTQPGTAILWAINTGSYGAPGPAVLHAIDATAIGSELWNSTQVPSDQAGSAVKFAVPTIANGKVYVGTSTEVDVYGLTGNMSQPPATPAISPTTETVSTPVHVSITDGTAGATIYYTKNGTTPTINSTRYTRAFTISATSTIQAIAAENGLTSGVASATYTFVQAVAPPAFAPVAGTYTGFVTISISDTTSGALIYYTTDGSSPSPGQGTTQLYLSTLTITKTTHLRAIAVNGTQNSSVTTATYSIKSGL